MREKLPSLTQQPILFVDGTPDDGYPLRILRAYLQNCFCFWTDAADGSEPSSLVLKLMNKHQEQRARILDKAIKILEQARKDK